MKNKPKTIYLVLGDSVSKGDDFEDICDEVCWCQDRVFPDDIEYIRKDLYDSLKKRYDELKASDGRPWPCDMQQEGM